MSGTGEYGVSAPSKLYYRVIDEEYARNMLDIWGNTYGYHVNMTWDPKPRRKYEKQIYLWGKATYSDKSILIHEPLFGVVVHEFAHLLSVKKNGYEGRGHTTSFKETLQELWDDILDATDIIEQLEKFSLHLVHYPRHMFKYFKNAGFEIDVHDEVIGLHDSLEPMFVAKVLHFISDERASVEIIKKLNGRLFRGNVGEKYYVDLKILDTAQFYSTKMVDINKLTPEQEALLSSALTRLGNAK